MLGGINSQVTFVVNLEEGSPFLSDNEAIDGRQYEERQAKLGAEPQKPQKGSRNRPASRRPAGI